MICLNLLFFFFGFFLPNSRINGQMCNYNDNHQLGAFHIAGNEYIKNTVGQSKFGQRGSPNILRKKTQKLSPTNHISGYNLGLVTADWPPRELGAVTGRRHNCRRQRRTGLLGFHSPQSRRLSHPAIFMVDPLLP